MLRLSQDQAFFAHPFEGRMFDCGSKDGFIQANVAFALARDDIRDLVFEPIEAMIASQARAQRSGLIDWTATAATAVARPSRGPDAGAFLAEPRSRTPRREHWQCVAPKRNVGAAILRRGRDAYHEP